MDGQSEPTQMPCHGPANMLDLFMTRYDYDYNRDPLKEFPHENMADPASNDDAWLSGEVRNRPPFCMGGDWNGDTIYRQDYVPKSRFLDDMNEVHRRIGDEPYATAFIREWYRPDLTKNNTDDGKAPISEYQTEYTNSGRIPKGKPALYAGALSVPYKEDFLHAKGVREDDGSDLPPKITSKESLLPRHPQAADESAWKAREELLPSRRPLLHSMPADPKDYYCTSWEYGDKSKAYPSQLPQGLEGSKRADLIGTMDDKAELLRLLAGKDATKAGKPYRLDDDTNPIYVSSEEQRKCAVTHRMEDEGHVKMTIYNSDYINQWRLPELPGNHGGADERNTQTTALSSAGEMAAGQLTKYTREMGSLRNSHGYMRHIPKDGAKLPMPREVLTTLRQLERHDDVDVADPHRHKMHKVIS